MKCIAFAAVATALLTVPAFAVTLSVNETAAPGGDYANALGAAGNNFGFAPAGTTEVNVSGSLRCSDISACTGGLNDLFDAFYFNASPTQEITEIKISTEGTDNLLDFFLEEGGINLITANFATNATQTVLAMSGAPLDMGIYNLGLGFSPGQSGSFAEIDYVITAQIRDIAPVPLPAGLPLLLAGLGGLALLRRGKAA